MKAPGVRVGVMSLPLSYRKAQLEEWGWNGTEFTRPPTGGWGSKVNGGWQDAAPRSRRRVEEKGRKS